MKICLNTTHAIIGYLEDECPLCNMIQKIVKIEENNQFLREKIRFYSEKNNDD